MVPSNRGDRIRTCDLLTPSQSAGNSKPLSEQQDMADDERACILDCIQDAKNDNASGQVDGIDAGFTEAIRMIAKLPLTAAEKAQAVRRLLAREGMGK